jgi:ATP-dependent RNA helicase DHX36
MATASTTPTATITKWISFKRTSLIASLRASQFKYKNSKMTTRFSSSGRQHGQKRTFKAVTTENTATDGGSSSSSTNSTSSSSSSNSRTKKNNAAKSTTTTSTTAAANKNSTTLPKPPKQKPLAAAKKSTATTNNNKNSNKNNAVDGGSGENKLAAALSASATATTTTTNNNNNNNQRGNNRRGASAFKKKVVQASNGKQQSVKSNEDITLFPNGRKRLNRVDGKAFLDLYKEQTGGDTLCKSIDESKNLLHFLQQKMSFKQKLTFSTSGPAHQSRFVSTLEVPIQSAVFASLNVLPSSAKVEGDLVTFVGGGVAYSKRESTALAALDILKQLLESGINPKNPPNMAELKEAAMKKRIQNAQALLELVDSSRPQIDISKRQDGRAGFQATLSCFVDGGKKLDGLGHGKSKSEAEGNALLNASEEPLRELLGENVMKRLKKVMDESPGGHVATLRIQALPDEAVEVLVNAMGSPDEHDARVLALKTECEQLEQRREEKEARNAENGGSTPSWRKKDENLNEYLFKSKNPEDLSKAEEILAKKFRDERALASKEILQEELERERKAKEDENSEEAKMARFRGKLPIIELKEDLLKALETQSVVVVSGGTGTGKSTQCPQYILEDALKKGRGAETKIIVTQPRRIAAISVAERVAAERCEPIGNSVGYRVRLHGSEPRSTGGTVQFVTTGVLLRRLVRDPEISDVSHVIIDEVHERDINTDFLLVLLKELIQTRKDLKVVLMSATLDAESFSKYFSTIADTNRQTPLLSVPPKPRHPVELHYLEDILERSALSAVDTKNDSDDDDANILVASNENEMTKFKNNDWPANVRRLAAELLHVQDLALARELEEVEAESKASMTIERIADAEDAGEQPEFSEDELEDDDEDDSRLNDDEDSLNAWEDKMKNDSRQHAHGRPRLQALRRAVALKNDRTNIGKPEFGGGKMRRVNKNVKLGDRDQSEVAVNLVAEMATHIAMKEIENNRKGTVLCFLPGWDEIKSATELIRKSATYDEDTMKIMPLHSSVPQEEQQAVFKPAKNGTMKIILSTNIAESSVTIDDVLSVIDAGLVREMSYNAESAMSSMDTVLISSASATQRSGRAGRVAPGSCFRIYSRGVHASMAERPTPEIQRTALEATCLQTASMTETGVQKFLSKALDPPSEDTVSYAVDRLTKLGAIQTTIAGEKLTPLGRTISNLPIDPAIARMLLLGCVTKCLDPILTACASYSSRDPFYVPPGMRDEARSIRQSFHESSDLLAICKAWDQCNNLFTNRDYDTVRRWGSDNFISIVAMSNLTSVRAQLLNELIKLGFVSERDCDGYGQRRVLRHDASINTNANNDALFKGLIATGLPSNLAARRSLGSFGTLRTRTESHAGLHPSGVAFHRSPPRGVNLPKWFVYREMVLSSSVFLRDSTALSPEQVALFAGHKISFAPKLEEELGQNDDDNNNNNNNNNNNTLLKADGSINNSTDMDMSFDGDDMVPSSRFDRSAASRAKFLLDEWVLLDSNCEDTMDLLRDAREELNMALIWRVMYPRKPPQESSEQIVDAIASMLRIIDERDRRKERTRKVFTKRRFEK